MTVALTHATAADGTFSTAGAAAWNAGHVLTGAANAVPFFGGAANALTDSSSLTYDDSTKRLTVAGTAGSDTTLLVKSVGTDDVIRLGTQTAGNGGVISSANNALSAYAPLNLIGTTIDFRPSNGSKMTLVTTAGAGPSITAGTAASAVSALSLTQTWNYNTAAINAVDWTFTDTSSHASTLAWRVRAGAAGATLLASLSKGGDLTVGASLAAGDGGAYQVYSGASRVGFFIGGASSRLAQASGGNIVWTNSATDANVTIDTNLSRIAAGVLGVGTGAAGSVAGQLHAGMLQASLGTALTLTQGAIGMSKMTASGSAPGATGAKFEVVAGTNAGTAKLIMYAGTSTTATTIIDNVGSGVS